MKKLVFFIFIIFLGISSFIHTQNAEAANISMKAPEAVYAGESLEIIIYTDTDEVLINSIETVISYDENLFSFVGYRDDSSMIKLWIEPPHALNGKIYFSGIIPGGIQGIYDANKTELAPIPLVHLSFTVKNVGNAQFSFVDSAILKHDGAGTPLPHEKLGIQIQINRDPNNNPEEQKNTGEEAASWKNFISSFSPLHLFMWIILILIICSIIGYKLLKYRNEK